MSMRLQTHTHIYTHKHIALHISKYWQCHGASEVYNPLEAADNMQG